MIDKRKGAPAPPTSAPNAKDSEAKWLRLRRQELETARRAPSTDAAMLVDVPATASAQISDVVGGEAAALWTEERGAKLAATVAEGEKRAAQQIADRNPNSEARQTRLQDEKAKQAKRVAARGSVTIGSIGENVHRGIYVPTSTRIHVFMERRVAEANSRQRVEQMKRISGTDGVTSCAVSEACQQGVTHCFVESLERESQQATVSRAALLARMVGAHYVDQFWLDASVCAGRFVAAPRIFTVKSLTSMQLFFHAVIVGMPLGKSCWVEVSQVRHITSDSSCVLLVESDKAEFLSQQKHHSTALRQAAVACSKVAMSCAYYSHRKPQTNELDPRATEYRNQPTGSRT